MKKKLPFVIVFFSASLCSWCQKIQYSKDVFPIGYAYQTQLVANVAGYHHLLLLNTEKKPLIYIFDNTLRFFQKVELAYQFSRSAKVKILPFQNFYYLYIHADNSNRHDLWRINGDGKTYSLSQKFQSFVDSAFGKKNVMLQLFNEGNSLYVIAHTYFDKTKSVESAIAKFDQDFDLLSFNKVDWPFDLAREALQQILLRDNNLYILKKANNEVHNGFLQVVKINCASGEFITTSFESFSKRFSFAAINLTGTDSSLLVYGVIDETPDRIWMTREFFFAELDGNLRQRIPLRLLKTPFAKKSGTNFFFVEGKQQKWINMHTFSQPFTEFISTDTTNADGKGLNYHDYLSYLYDYNYRIGTQFSVLDDSLKLKTDTLVKGKFSSALQSYPTAEVKLNNKNYLALLQVFDNKRRTLLLVGTDEKANFQTINVPVYESYEYDLSELQVVDGTYFIMPYIDKAQIGLLKVAIEESLNLTMKN